MLFRSLERVIESVVGRFMPDDGNPGAILCNDGIPHLVFVNSAEEHDAEFRPSDRIGFTHINLSVVPLEFIRAAQSVCVEFTSGLLNSQGEMKIDPSAFPQGGGYQIIALDGPVPGASVSIASSSDAIAFDQLKGKVDQIGRAHV